MLIAVMLTTVLLLSAVVLADVELADVMLADVILTSVMLTAGRLLLWCGRLCRVVCARRNSARQCIVSRRLDVRVTFASICRMFRGLHLQCLTHSMKLIYIE